jgi:hypothetical protein
LSGDDVDRMTGSFDAQVLGRRLAGLGMERTAELVRT